ncbi:NADH-quinone oxidoreductase subunit NuoH [Saccharolobus solfataricus]|uniref:NADH dehydrogenase subunit H (NuoH) n=3 Tax=Saccharolobus solfataricus TaxID=2287 RepID=Q980H2_SACS2|nr:NADH-quinone oxidoreductase subunit NuoH [Saccharolobus solfataricus]AAK40660.1 NADH dehydrogenase subunit H (NuoH) [Saccharolobus solfataricus P2]AKA73637.1 NADH-quinone oxidoreductase subunit NuoH [Saccharolobus solfataricus]AKA76334.1 NADH-quinone oxidoreductase subunit NuoH [Saccharolobus solfataricus]AKA79026.1 NADH-quinone oxidoreductase subunit NuoH [Saccharolobus solfataricus]AZF68106.1 NADH-quinone oxidoreductase subunit NuoH [Saccharolobus solfataricus]
MSVLSALQYYFFYPSFFLTVIFPGLIFTLIFLLVTIWFERKAAAIVQLRYGPYYASKRLGGILQLFADAIKFVFSEIIIPNGVNQTLYAISPVLVLIFAFLPMALIPISTIPTQGSILSVYHGIFYDTQIHQGILVPYFIEYNLIGIIALESLYPILVIFLAWNTNNRFAIVGSIREAYLSVSYDVLIIISTLALGLEYHTLDVAKIVTSGIPGFIANPIAAFVFLVAMLIGSSRFPFEIVEAETELVIGPYTEYSGFLFVLTMAGSYVANLVYAILFVDLFLGGWLPFTGFVGAIFTVFKAAIVVFFAVFLRAVYGRYRIDQALRGSWKYFFPLALASLLLGVVVGYLWIR